MSMGRWWFTVPLRLRSLLRGGRVEREMDEELQFHLDHKIEEGIAQGLSREEARYAALRALGGLEQRKEEIRATRRILWLTDFVADVRFAIRNLRRTPGLSAFVVLTIAVGIGMTAMPFSLLDALVFRPFPVAHPDDVVTLASTSRDNEYELFSYREYQDIRERAKSYDGVIASAPVGLVGFSAEPGAVPRARAGMMVSGNYFRVLGVEPTVGRGFRDAEDEAPGRDAVMVLGPDFWKSEFGGDPSVVGRTVRLNGVDFTVIGVAPETFPGMLIFIRPDFYTPLAMARVFSTNPLKDFFVDRDDRELSVKARLRPGTTQRQAQNELTVLARSLGREYPKFNRDRGAAVHTPLEMRMRRDRLEWKFSVIVTGLGMAVLLVACTNVAGLLLSRARTRTREIAIRLALGAGRFRLVRLLLTESLVLALLGGLGGIALGYSVIDACRTFTIPTELPTVPPFQMDLRVLLACLALSVFSALVCGLAPALQSTRIDLLRGLKAADVEAPGRRRLWGRSALVVVQVSGSLMLLAAAFFLFRGFRQSLDEGVGFLKNRTLIAKFDPRLMQYDMTRTKQFYRQLVERAREMPGAESVALTQNPPLGLDAFAILAFVPEAIQMPRDRESFTVAMDTIDEGFFKTMGIPILRGRGFLPSDAEDAPRVAIVNDQFARHYWPDGDALGKHLRLDDANGEPVEIVGVAQTIKYRATTEKPTDFVYLPFPQHPQAHMALLVRSSADPLQLVEPVKEVVRSLDANMPALGMRSYEDLYRYHAVDGPGVAVELVSFQGLVGLLLAMAGLYGLVAYNVSRRTREIGIRVAIGARPTDILRLMMGKGVLLVGAGMVIGLAMGFAIERLMNAALFNAGGTDLLFYLLVVPTVLLVTLMATYLPARRAAQIAPTEALRYE